MRLYNACHADDNHLVWTDGHPKNIAVSDDQAMVFDFGRLVPWDSRYPLPNFLAQFFLIQWSSGKNGTRISQEMKSIQAAYESEIHKPFRDDDHRELIAYFCAELIGRIG